MRRLSTSRGSGSTGTGIRCVNRRGSAIMLRRSMTFALAASSIPASARAPTSPPACRHRMVLRAPSIPAPAATCPMPNTNVASPPRPHCWRLDMARAAVAAGELCGKKRAGASHRRPRGARRHHPRAQGCTGQLSSREHARRCRYGRDACHPRRRPDRLDRRPPAAPGAARPADAALSPPRAGLRSRRKKGSRSAMPRRRSPRSERPGPTGPRSQPIWPPAGFPLAISCKIPR